MPGRSVRLDGDAQRTGEARSGCVCDSFSRDNRQIRELFGEKTLPEWEKRHLMVCEPTLVKREKGFSKSRGHKLPL